MKIKIKVKSNTMKYLAVSITIMLMFSAMIVGAPGIKEDPCSDDCLMDVQSLLPDMVEVNATHTNPPLPNGPGYFITIITNNAYLEGEYVGWCIDLYTTMYDNQEFQAYVYSSYDPSLPDDVIDHPEYLPVINYILNYGFVGMESVCNGMFTKGDIQQAIWVILDGDTGAGYLTGPYDMCRVNEIIDIAMMDGMEFVPDCSEILAIVLDPVNEVEGQVSIIEFRLPDECEEENEGCSHGFWKNHHNAWVEYSPGEYVGNVFELPSELKSLNVTLDEALNFGGGPGVEGGAKILLRNAVASILNAVHSEINYPLLENEVIDQVNESLSSLDRDAMLDLEGILDDFNNLGSNVCDDDDDGGDDDDCDECGDEEEEIIEEDNEKGNNNKNGKGKPNTMKHKDMCTSIWGCKINKLF